MRRVRQLSAATTLQRERVKLCTNFFSGSGVVWLCVGARVTQWKTNLRNCYKKGISDQAERKFIDVSVIKSLECNYLMGRRGLGRFTQHVNAREVSPVNCQ